MDVSWQSQGFAGGDDPLSRLEALTSLGQELGDSEVLGVVSPVGDHEYFRCSLSLPYGSTFDQLLLAELKAIVTWLEAEVAEGERQGIIEGEAALGNRGVLGKVRDDFLSVLMPPRLLGDFLARVRAAKGGLEDSDPEY